MPRHQPRGFFIKGPLLWDWWSAASRSGGSGLHVASWIAQREGLLGELDVRYKPRELAELGLAENTARNGLYRLERAGLVAVERPPGCRIAVRRVVPVGMERARRASPRDAPWPLKLPIPWTWWIRAAKAPGSALDVALAIWFQAGWSRNLASFEFDISLRAALNLSLPSIGRGLDGLAAAGLLRVQRRPPRPPIVHVLDPNSPACPGGSGEARPGEGVWRQGFFRFADVRGPTDRIRGESG